MKFQHIFSAWLKIWLHTQNQLPRLPESTLKVCGGVKGLMMGGSGPAYYDITFNKAAGEG